MKNKNIVIVGGSSGIGLELTEKLHSDNNILIASRSNENLSHLTDITHIPYDSTQSNSRIHNTPDIIDGLVYCPGSINLKPFRALKDEDYLKDFEINLLGAVRSIKEVLNKLRKSEDASIVLFSTVAVQTGMPFHASIAAAKGAVEGLVRSLAAELSPKIRVNAVAPSLTNTPMAKNLLNTEEKIAASEKRHPLQSVGDPANIADTVRFLLSSESKWMTGQILHVDGGMSSIRKF